MKRFFFAFMAAISFSIASAQPASDASVILAKLDLDNVIFMIPQILRTAQLIFLVCFSWITLILFLQAEASYLDLPSTNPIH